MANKKSYLPELIDERYRILCEHVQQVLKDCPEDKVIEFIEFVDGLALELLHEEYDIHNEKNNRKPQY